jgi:hypothetical protein
MTCAVVHTLHHTHVPSSSAGPGRPSTAIHNTGTMASAAAAATGCSGTPGAMALVILVLLERTNNEAMSQIAKLDGIAHF